MTQLFDTGPWRVIRPEERSDASASLGEVWRSSQDEAVKASNHDALTKLVEDGYDRVNDRIKAATGEELENPTRWGSFRTTPILGGDAWSPEFAQAAWSKRLSELKSKAPDALPWDDLANEPMSVAGQVQRDTRQRHQEVMTARGMVDKSHLGVLGQIPILGSASALAINVARDPAGVAAQFGGSLAGQMTSPADAIANLLPFGVLRNQAAKSLIKNAAANAAANAGIQAVLSAGKMDDYKKAGLPYGWKVWLEEVEGAAATGAVLDLAIRGPGRAAIRRFGTDTPAGTTFSRNTERGGLFTDAPDRTIAPEVFQKAQEGDIAAAREIAEKTGAINDPAIKGAFDYLEGTGKLTDEALAELEKMGIVRPDGFRVLSDAIEGRVPEMPEPVRPATEPLMREEGSALVRERAGELEALMREASPLLTGGHPRLAQFIEDAVEAGSARYVTMVREALDGVRAGRAVAEEARSFVAKLQEIVRENPERFAAEVELRTSTSPLAIADSVRRFPEIVDTNTALDTDIVRMGRSIARLDDAAYGHAQRGLVPPQVAAMVAERVPRAHQGRVIEDLAKARPETLEEAKALVDELVPESRTETVPLDGGGERIDDPNGAAAKAQTEVLKQEAGRAYEEAFAPVEERQRLESEVETIRGAIAKMEAEPKQEGGAEALTAKRAELAEAEARLEEVRGQLLAAISDEPEGPRDPLPDGAVRAAVEREIRAMLPDDVVVRVLDRIDAVGDVDPYGLFDPAYLSIDPLTHEEVLTQAVLIAARGSSDNMLAIGRHEVIHALRASNLFTDEEWRTLVDNAVRHKIDERMEVYDPEGNLVPGIPYYAREYRADLESRGVSGDELEARLAEVLDQERVAWMAEQWQRKTIKFSKKIDALLERAMQFLEAIARALDGLGIRSLDDFVANREAARVAEGVMSGEIGRRPPRGAEPGSRAYALRHDIDTGQSMRRDLDALGYYSQALEAAKSWSQKKGTPEQALMWLKKSGVKDAEIEATGLKGFLDGKKSVTREEVVGHLEGNRVGLTESKYGAAELPPGAEVLSREELAARNNEPVERYQLKFFAIDERGTVIGGGSTRENAANLFKPKKWSSYSLDPENPTYRETVLHLPAVQKNDADAIAAMIDRGEITAEEGQRRYQASGLYDAGARETAFRSGHFPEPNIIGHMMTSMTTHQGKPVYTIDQIQSDWGQKLRDGGVRDEAKIADLRKRLDALSDVDLGEIRFLNRNPNVYISRIAELEGGFGVPEIYPGELARTKEKLAKVSDPRMQEKILLEAELRTAEAATPGNPLVNTTDQWVNTTLRRAIRQAAEAGADYIAIPSGDTVLSYNPGDKHGMRSFYGIRAPTAEELAGARSEMSDEAYETFAKSGREGIVPKNLRNLLAKIDKSIKPQHVDTLDSPSGKSGLGKGFTLFPLTDKVKSSVMTEGQPLFALRGKRSVDGTPSETTKAGRTILDWLMRRPGANAAPAVVREPGSLDALRSDLPKYDLSTKEAVKKASADVSARIEDEFGFTNVSIRQTRDAVENAREVITGYRLIADVTGIDPKIIGGAGRADLRIGQPAGRDSKLPILGLHMGYAKWMPKWSPIFGRARQYVRGGKGSSMMAEGGGTAQVAIHEWAHFLDHVAGQQAPIHTGAPRIMATRRYNPLVLLDKPLGGAFMQILWNLGWINRWPAVRNFYWMRPEARRAWGELTAAIRDGETRLPMKLREMLDERHRNRVDAPSEAVREKIKAREREIERVHAPWSMAYHEAVRRDQRIKELKAELESLDERADASMLPTETPIRRAYTEGMKRYHPTPHEMFARAFEVYVFEKAQRLGYDVNQLERLFNFDRDLYFGPDDRSYEAMIKGFDDVFATMKTDAKNHMLFALRGNRPSDEPPTPPIKSDIAFVDRLNQIKDLVEACRA